MKTIHLIVAMCIIAYSASAQEITPSHAPKVSLFEAVRLVEKYISDQKIHLSPNFLSSVRYIRNGNSEAEPYWEVTFQEAQTLPTGPPTFRVSMNSKVERQPGE